MQIVLALLIAAAIGAGVHFLLPHRSTRGVVLAPMIAAAVGGVVWTALTWAGLGIENPWIWLAAIVAPIVVTVPAVLLISAARVRGDARERARLGLV
jgi:hypothetical protein